MKITAWILVVAALAVLGSLGGLLLGSAERTPHDLLESAVRRTLQGDPDYKGALSDLDQALDLAAAAKDHALVGDILVQRGRILRNLGAIGPARMDLQIVVEEYRPGDKGVEMELVSLDLTAGNLAAALERTGDVLRRDANYTPAWTYRGQIMIQLSGEHIERCEEVLRSVAPAEQAEKAVDLIHRISGMDLGDPLRVALLHDLRSYFDPAEEQETIEVLRLVDLSSQAITDAREAFAQSFGGQLIAESIYDYLHLLMRSGHNREAIEFGLAVMHQPAANSSVKTVKLLMEALTAAGRADTAARLVEEHMGRRVFPDQEFYLSWCRTLHTAERWRTLLFVASRMREAGDDDYRAMANFYLGLSQSKIGDWDQARIALERFAREETLEPVPGALAQAWRLLALAVKDKNETFTEKNALYSCTRLDPNLDGDAWLRLAELLQQTEQTSFTAAEQAMTHALRLLPDRVDELLPRWCELGENSLRAAGVGIDMVYADLETQHLLTPTNPIGPYELYRLALLYESMASPAGVAAACKRILVDYPGFRPALDMYVAAATSLGDHKKTAELLLESIERFGNDPRTVSRVYRLPEGTLDKEEVLHLMQLDPEFTGRLAVASALQEEGRTQQALNGLLSVGLENLRAEGRVLAGELMLTLGHHAAALDVLGSANRGAAEYAAALPTRLLSAVESGNADLVASILEEPLRADQLDRERLLPVADRLMLAGMARQAQLLLELLDSFPETRSSDAVLRLAMAAMLQGERTLALESLDRAEALGSLAFPSFGRVLLAIEDEAWGTLPLAMAELEDLGPEAGQLRRTAMALIDERTDQALRRIEHSDSEPRDEALWILLRHSAEILRAEFTEPDLRFGRASEAETLHALYGMGSGKRDPRPLLAFIAALDVPEWAVWATAALQRARIPAEGSLWPAYLAARGYAFLGHPKEALRILNQITEAWPTFAPAWDFLEELELERLGRIDDLELVQLRHQRRRVLGRRPGEAAEEQLTVAWAAEAAGNYERAIRSARESVDIDPRFLPGHVKLAQIYAQQSQHDAAIRAYQDAFALAEQDQAHDIVDEFLAVLETAHREDPDKFPRSLVQAELETLGRKLDRDPLLVLALARDDLLIPGLNPALCVARSYERLERFRKVTEGAPIESLRPGATRRWKEFYAKLDPRRAEAFVRYELSLRPGSLDLWTMLGETFQAQDRLREAVDLLKTVQVMVPDSEGCRRIASLLTALGADNQEVEKHLQLAQSLDELAAPDKDILLTRAKSVFDLGQQGRDVAVQLLAELWRNRDDEDDSVDAATIGQVYGTCLVQRGHPDDRELAYQVLQETAELLEESTRKNLVIALSHLGQQIPVRRKARP